MRDGTKNTGNHFANTAAPGDKTRYTASPREGSREYKPIIVANKIPQPPSADGNEIENALKSLRKKMSSAIRLAVDAIAANMFS
jgi:hypothetical protein